MRVNATLIAPFKNACIAAGIEVPEPITRAEHVISTVRGFERFDAGTALELSDEQLLERVLHTSILQHEGPSTSRRGLAPGILDTIEQVTEDLHRAMVPVVEELTEQLRPKFVELAAPIVRGAQEFGFTWQTTSDEVIDRADENVADAWRAVKPAWAALKPIASFRQSMSRFLDVSPTREELYITDPREHLNYSPCFAAGENWGTDGAYYLTKKAGGGIDWFALGVGGITLNSPAEVKAKLTARFGAGV